MGKITRTIVFLEKRNGTYNFLFSRRYSSETLKVNDRTILIDVEKPFYVKKRNLIYIVDYNTGTQIVGSEIKSDIQPRVLDSILQTKILKEIVQGAERSEKPSLMSILMSIAMFFMGFMLSYILFVQNAKPDEIIIP